LDKCKICNTGFKKGRNLIVSCAQCTAPFHSLCSTQSNSLFLKYGDDLFCHLCTFPFSDTENDDEIFVFNPDPYVVLDHNTIRVRIKTLKGGLRIAHINVQSINSLKIHKLQHFVAETKIDVLSLTETWLDNKSTDNLEFPDYTFFRQDRINKKGGGILTYVHNRLTVTEIHLQAKFDNDTQFLVISIQYPNSKPLIILTLYRPPGNALTNDDPFFVILTELSTELIEISNDICILGDFNINLLSTNYPPTTKILSLLNNNGLIQQITHPTRVTKSSATLIDHIYYTKPKYVREAGVIPLDISDHHLTFIVLKKPKVHYNPKIINTRNYKDINNEKLLKEFCKEGLFKNTLDALHVDNKIDSFNNTSCNVLNKYCPKVTRRIKSRPATPWIDGPIKRMIHRVHFLRGQKSKLAAKLIKSPSEENEAKLDEAENEYKSNRNITNGALKHAHNKHFQTEFSKKQTPKQSWNTFKTLIGDADQARQVKLLLCDGIQIKDTKSIMSLLAEAFQVPRPDPTFFLIRFHSSLRPMEFPEFDFSSISKIILDTKSDCGHGVHGIPAKVIKYFCGQLSLPIADIFHNALLTGSFPNAWKTAAVVPVLKKNCDLTNPLSYRPISTLPFLSKVFEKYISQLILNHLFEHNIKLNPHQYGFRTHRSTFQAIADLTQLIYEYVDKKLFTAVVFIDLTKAFDSITYEKLLIKLRDAFKFPTYLLKLIANYFLDRYFKLTINNAVSDNYKLHAGVPQGSVLGPLLFILFFDDLSNLLLDIAQFFADDVAITLADKCLVNLIRRMTELLEEVNAWCAGNDLSLNSKKTKILFITKPAKFKSKVKKLNQTVITPIPSHIATTFGDIEIVDKFIYLGLTLDKTLNFALHISKINNLISFKAQQLIKNKRSISSKLFPTIFKATVMPYLDYALPAFCHNPDLQNVQKTINHFLKCYFVKGYQFRRSHYINQSKLDKLTNLTADSTMGKVKLKSKPFKSVSQKDILYYHKEFGLQTVRERSDYLTLTTMHNIKYNDLNNRLNSLFDTNDNTNGSSSRLLNIPVTRVSAFLSTSYRCRAIKLYNSLPKTIKAIDIYDNFKDSLKQHIATTRLKDYVFFQ